MTTRTLSIVGVIGALAIPLFGCDPSAVQEPEASVEQGVTEKDFADAGEQDFKAELKLAPEHGDYVAVLETAKGDIVLMFHPERAPKHVANFIALAELGFYDGTRFHRVIAGFMIQGGDPQSKDVGLSDRWGLGGNVGMDGREINVPAEFNDISHVRGVLSMAKSPEGPNTASSQFYIVHADSAHLNRLYTAFGRIVTGLEVVDKIVEVSRTKDANGGVFPKYAVVVDKISIKTWPLKE